MLARDIYKASLALLSESQAAGENDDYEERAPYILAVLCTELEYLDASLRDFTGESRGESFEGVYLDLERSFPLLDRLSGAAALYLASMLVSDTNSTLSDSLFAKYCDCVSSVGDYLAGQSESIVNKYFNN